MATRRPTASRSSKNARRAAGMAQENPLGLAIGSIAAGFIVGLLLPSSRVEDQKLGPMADDVRAKAKETGQEALERGQEVVQETAQVAQQTRCRRRAGSMGKSSPQAPSRTCSRRPRTPS